MSTLLLCLLLLRGVEPFRRFVSVHMIAFTPIRLDSNSNDSNSCRYYSVVMSNELDTFQFFVQELGKLRQDIDHVESRIVDFESKVNFDGADVRYRRLLDDKKVLLVNLCELRIHLISRSITRDVETNSHNKRRRLEAEGPLSQDKGISLRFHSINTIDVCRIIW
jgi:hypothetical protein